MHVRTRIRTFLPLEKETTREEIIDELKILVRRADGQLSAL